MKRTGERVARCLRFGRDVTLVNEICQDKQLHDDICKKECRNYPR